ncbi:MAG: redoxin family protein [Phycisphaerae bacterium]|jgi:thiol-disulfide isomerase/thioredoxin|nr:redoxin family protein [Phycisphaerae bacterium]MCZ2401003.1 redoxin family protein [Phycisphaerae bacterium]NUQ49961.1 redoxin family protein [Phycisphaerae bacterium]
MKSVLASVLAVALFAAAAAVAGEGKLGDAAPALQISEWVKHGPVDVTAKDKVYVVEFWATWCGPCVRNIPHLTELQKKHKDKVVFVGVTREKPDVVKPFVEKQGDKMDYVVAIDKDGGTHKGYMEAFEVRGIPHAFIVDRAGKIAWQDHPASPEFEKALEVLVSGDKAAYDKLRAAAEDRQRAQQLSMKYYELVTAEEVDKAEARKVGEELLAIGGKNASLMNELSWGMLTAPNIKYRDLELALRMAKAAYDACEGKDAAIVDTYARALFDNGKVKEALEYQRKAVEMCKDEGMLPQLKEALEQYEKAAKGG